MTQTIAGLPVIKVREQEPYFNILIYGESGTGKTKLAGSSDEVPGMRKVLFIDVEGGTLTLRSWYPDVDVVRVKSWKEMQSIYNELYIGGHGYNTIVIDSLTETQKISMDQIMRRLIEENEERDADVPGIREWNVNLEQTRKFVRMFRDLPVNTIFTSLVKVDKNLRTGSIRRKPSLSGKVSDEVAGFLDIVVYLYTKEVGDENKRMLLTGQTEDTVAKDRSNRLPLVIENPTMEALYNHMYAKES